MTTETIFTLPPEHQNVIEATGTVIEQFAQFMGGDNTSVVINTEDEYTMAAEVIRVAKEHKKKIKDSKETVCGPLHKKWKSALALFTPKLDSITDKIDALETAGRAFRKEADRKAAEEQKQRELEAQKERDKLESQAEKASDKAEEYREQGREDKAQEWEQKAQIKSDLSSAIVAPIVTPSIPKNTRGAFNTRKYYEAKINDINAVLDYFKEKGVPPNVKNEIQKWGNAQATANKGVKSSISGIEFIEK
jgi:hypothetical protein